MYRSILAALVIIVSLSSCDTYKRIPLSRVYRPDPVSIARVPGLSRDLAWNRAVRLFADRNVSIKMIDKSSGFIQSDVISFVSAYQIDSSPVPALRPVYVVTQRERAYDTVIQPSYITGYLRIFILNDSDQTEIRVSIDGLRNFHLVNVHHSHSSVVTHDEINREVVSTGKLESEVADYIRTGLGSPDLTFQNGEILNPENNYAQYLNKKNKILTRRIFGGYFGGLGLLAAAIVLAFTH